MIKSYVIKMATTLMVSSMRLLSAHVVADTSLTSIQQTGPTYPFAGEAIGRDLGDGARLHDIRQSLDGLGSRSGGLRVGPSRLSRLHVVAEDVATSRADEPVVAAPTAWSNVLFLLLCCVRQGVIVYYTTRDASP